MIVDDATFETAARRLKDNRRFAVRDTKEPSLLMGLVPFVMSSTVDGARGGAHGKVLLTVGGRWYRVS